MRRAIDRLRRVLTTVTIENAAGCSAEVRIYRWAGGRWLGLPGPLRVLLNWFEERHPHYDAFVGCGCLVWLKGRAPWLSPVLTPLARTLAFRRARGALAVPPRVIDTAAWGGADGGASVRVRRAR